MTPDALRIMNVKNMKRTTVRSERVRRRLAAVLLAALAACGGPATGPAGESGSPAAAATLSPETPVAVTGGRVRGTPSEIDPEIMAFRGVPYAAPPVGGLRWRPPAAVVPWEGVRDAAAAGPICPQQGGADAAQSEDCLTLNVWAPRRAAEPLPVMVWIHGGGYRLGSGSGPTYDGAPLAANGVVLVTFNYRLNVFGFLAHPALSAESGRDASGNYGLMDMVAALEWVRDNASAFGGDPSRVTLFGESAGGGAVMAIMLVPHADGLFHRAIAQSTYVHGWDRPLREAARGWAEPAEAQGVRVAAALGASGENALEAMRAAAAAEVLEAAGAGGLFRWTGTVWAPNVDGWMVPDDPIRLYEDGRQHDVPLVAGVNANEGSLFRSRLGIEDAAAFESYVRTDYAGVAEEALALYGVTSADAVDAGVDALIHDLFFAGPVRLQVRAHAQAASPAWLYRFARAPPTPGGARFGAHHAAELAYVFGTLDSAPGGEWTDVDRRLSDAMMAYWTQFAAAGDPNGDGLPAWPAFAPPSDRHLVLADAVTTGAALDLDGAALFDRFEARRR